jgi:hypothetical protein
MYLEGTNARKWIVSMFKYVVVTYIKGAVEAVLRDVLSRETI